MKIPTSYKHRVKEAYKDEDGYWIILAESWCCPNWYSGNKTIHEDSYANAIKILNEARFTLRD